MLSEAHFKVFQRYETAGAHAFSTGMVTDADKDIYQEIFVALRDAAEQSIASPPFSGHFKSWTVRFGRKGGVQGHRPPNS